MQLVLLGTGDAWMEAALHGLAMSYPGWAVGVAEFQVPEQDCLFGAPFALHCTAWAGALRVCPMSVCECNQRTCLALLLSRFVPVALIMTCALFGCTHHAGRMLQESIAHQLLAAADYVLVPSRFEPCGLVAQAALRYGAVPIVTAVGGLRDLVTPEVHPSVPCLSKTNVCLLREICF